MVTNIFEKEYTIIVSHFLAVLRNYVVQLLPGTVVKLSTHPITNYYDLVFFIYVIRDL